SQFQQVAAGGDVADQLFLQQVGVALAAGQGAQGQSAQGTVRGDQYSIDAGEMPLQGQPDQPAQLGGGLGVRRPRIRSSERPAPESHGTIEGVGGPQLHEYGVTAG